MHITHKNTLILILIIGFGAMNIVFSAQASERIDLDQALAIAFKQNPTLVVSNNDVKAARARLTQATAAYYPQLAASAGASRIGKDSVSTSYNNTMTDSYAVGLSLTQYLYDFGKTAAGIKQNSHLFGSSQRELKAVENGLVRDVKTAYFNVLQSQKLIEVAKENLTVRQQQLKQAQALYGKGLNPKIDVTRGEVDLSQARLDLVMAEHGLTEAVISFETFLGGPPKAGPYTLEEQKTVPILCPPIERLLQRAVDNRPEHAGLLDLVEAARAALTSVQKKAYPSFEARGTYSFDDDALPMEDHQWQAGVYLNWPIFTGFKQTGEAVEAQAALDRLLALTQEDRLLITKEVTLSYSSLETAFEVIKSAKTRLGQARENVIIARGRYGAGVSDFIELSDAQLLFSQSQSDLIQSEYGYLKALAELEFSVGDTLTEENKPII